MATESLNAPSTSDAPRVPAGPYLPEWTVGQLPPPPPRGWRTWIKLIGPGVLLAGASIGSGEWLFGPAVSAQYGATLLWLAGLSILFQVFCNLEMMRYTVYCGESIIVGYLRTWPGPRFWMMWYALMDVSAIWPFNASNAAVPLAAAMLGRLPGPGSVIVAGLEVPEWQLVKLLGYAIFLIAFVPLIFGGTIYKMLERVMALKLVLVLGFLCVTALFMVSATNAWEVVSGFFRVGTVPLRAETIIAGPHFTLSERDGPVRLTIKGTIEDDAPLVTEYNVDRTAQGAERIEKYTERAKLPADLQKRFAELTHRAAELARPGLFLVRDEMRVERGQGSGVRGQDEENPSPLAGPGEGPAPSDSANPASGSPPSTGSLRSPPSPTTGEGQGTLATITVAGRIDDNQQWQPEKFTVVRAGESPQHYDRLSAVPEPYRDRFAELVANQGLQLVGLVGYFREHGALPPLDWAMLAAFAAIAGAGGMTNTLFSNYARDAGWGMGARVGTIPSAIGGRNIQLSHVGEVFPLDEPNRPRWRGWLRHVYRDQLAVWMLCSVIGMAIPCMLSLQFIRHAPVAGDRVAAMMAGGMADRYPQWGQPLWAITLLCGFLVLFPGQILAGDNISRRWTDIVWTSNSRARRMGGDRVRWIYYGILSVYGAWGLITLTLFDPLQIAKISTVLMNVALGWTAIHAVYVNRALLPRALQSPLIMQLGAIGCGLFFLSISAIVFYSL